MIWNVLYSSADIDVIILIFILILTLIVSLILILILTLIVLSVPVPVPILRILMKCLFTCHKVKTLLSPFIDIAERLLLFRLMYLVVQCLFLK